MTNKLKVIGYIVPDLWTGQAQKKRRDGKYCLKLYVDRTSAKRAIGLSHPTSKYNTPAQNWGAKENRKKYTIKEVYCYDE